MGRDKALLECAEAPRLETWSEQVFAPQKI